MAKEPEPVETMTVDVRAGFFVYLAYDAQDRLLYIGRSERPFVRFGQHCTAPRYRRWGGEAVRLELRRFKTWREACQVEEGLIRLHKPPFNVAGIDDYDYDRKPASRRVGA